MYYVAILIYTDTHKKKANGFKYKVLMNLSKAYMGVIFYCLCNFLEIWIYIKNLKLLGEKKQQREIKETQGEETEA